MNINFGFFNYSPVNINDFRNVFIPFAAWGSDYDLLTGASRYIFTKIVKHQPCNKCFRALPLGKSFKEIAESSKVWLHFIDKADPGLFGLTRGTISDTVVDVGITRAAMDRGLMFVVATIVHELAHVNGALGIYASPPSNAAESTLKQCLLVQQFNPETFGALDEMFRDDSGEALA